MPPSIAEQHQFLDFAKEYNFAKVRQLIEKDVTYVNAQPAGRWTALHQACHQGDSSIVEFLLRKGADTTVTTKDGETPRAVAQGRGHTACVKLLDDHTEEGEGEAEPELLEKAPAGLKLEGGSLSGEPAKYIGAYHLDRSKLVNGRPAYQHTGDATLWIAFAGNGWMGQSESDLGEYKGHLALTDSAAASPDVSAKTWQAWTGSAWIDAPQLKLSAHAGDVDEEVEITCVRSVEERNAEGFRTAIDVDADGGGPSEGGSLPGEAAKYPEEEEEEESEEEEEEEESEEEGDEEGEEEGDEEEQEDWEVQRPRGGRRGRLAAAAAAAARHRQAAARLAHEASKGAKRSADALEEAPAAKKPRAPLPPLTLRAGDSTTEVSGYACKESDFLRPVSAGEVDGPCVAVLPEHLYPAGPTSAVALQAALEHLEKTVDAQEDGLTPPFARGLGFVEWAHAVSILHFLGAPAALQTALEALDPVDMLVNECVPSLVEYRKACGWLRACETAGLLDKACGWEGVGALIAHKVLGSVPDLKALGLSFGDALDIFKCSRGAIATNVAHSLILGQMNPEGEYFWTSAEFCGLAAEAKAELCESLYRAVDLAPRAKMDDYDRPEPPDEVKVLEDEAALRSVWSALAKRLPSSRYVLSTRGSITAHSDKAYTHSTPDISIGGTMTLTMALNGKGAPPAAKIEAELELGEHTMVQSHPDEPYEKVSDVRNERSSVTLRAPRSAWPEGGPVWPVPAAFKKGKRFSTVEQAIEIFEGGYTIDKPVESITEAFADQSELVSFFAWWIASWEQAANQAAAQELEEGDGDGVVVGAEVFKVLKQVHPDFTLGEGCFRLINKLLTDCSERVFAQSMDQKDAIKDDEVKTAISEVLPGELLKHAILEGQKAVRTFRSDDSDDFVLGSAQVPAEWAEDGALITKAGLQFDPTGLITVFEKLSRPVTHSALVFFTAVIEYLTAELLESSGNAALDRWREKEDDSDDSSAGVANQDNSQLAISVADVLCAVRSDEELEQLFGEKIDRLLPMMRPWPLLTLLNLNRPLPPNRLDLVPSLLRGTLRDLGAAIWQSGDMHGYWTKKENCMAFR